MFPAKKTSTPPPPANRSRRRLWAGAAVVFALGGSLFFFTGGESSATESSRFHQVKRGNMLVSIVEGGTLRSASEVSIVSQVEGQTNIIFLIPEGTEVTRGDLLVELDSSQLEESLTQREIAFADARSRFTEARENLAIKKSESESQIALAELTVEFAHTDQDKYIDGDWPQQARNAEAAIQLADEELARARERLEFTIDLHEKGYATRSELQADQLTVTRRGIELDRAREEARLLDKYERPRRLRELESNLEQAKASLDRARSRALAELSQAEATLNARKATYDLEETRLARLKRQLDNTRIFAPQTGLVVYGSQGRDQTPIEEGASVRERQEIIKLPDLSRMVVDVKVHESQISQVRRGQTALVTIDSIPDRRFRGRVQRVAVLPDSQSRWLNPDLKVYTTEVLIEDDLPAINPGVSARAEIIVSQLEDVIQVPIQAVSTSQGSRVVYIQNGSSSARTPVMIGMFNDTHVHVREGLNVNDRILLTPPRRTLNEDFLPLAIGDQDVDRVAEARGTGDENASEAPPEEPQRGGNWQNLSEEERAARRQQRS
jgi:HlyD family secretion protein